MNKRPNLAIEEQATLQNENSSAVVFSPKRPRLPSASEDFLSFLPSSAAPPSAPGLPVAFEPSNEISFSSSSSINDSSRSLDEDENVLSSSSAPSLPVEPSEGPAVPALPIPLAKRFLLPRQQCFSDLVDHVQQRFHVFLEHFHRIAQFPDVLGLFAWQENQRALETSGFRLEERIIKDSPKYDQEFDIAIQSALRSIAAGIPGPEFPRSARRLSCVNQQEIPVSAEDARIKFRTLMNNIRLMLNKPAARAQGVWAFLIRSSYSSSRVFINLPENLPAELESEIRQKLTILGRCAFPDENTSKINFNRTVDEINRIRQGAPWPDQPAINKQ